MTTRRVKDVDLGFKQLFKDLRRAKGGAVHVGFFSGKKSARTGGKADNPTIAAIHEFGTREIPARPFIRPGLESNAADSRQLLNKLSKDFYDGKKTAKKVLNILGASAATAIKNFVTQGPSIPPPLKPATIARKGSSRALVDTGQLVNSITWHVVKANGASI